MESEPGEFLADARDERAQEFRKYLESSGLMETLTKMLAELYESNARPNGDASIAYCRDYFSKIDGVDINVVRAENEHLQERLNDLNNEIERLTKQIEGTE